MVIPSMDSVLDGYGRNGGPMDRRDVTFTFRVRGSDQDAAYDLLAAQVAPGYPQRLVYQPDNPTAPLRFTVGYNPKIQYTLTAAGRGLDPHCDFTVTWRIRPDWRPRFSEAEPAMFAAANTTVFSALNNEVFLAPGSVAITAAPQTFTMDATGTAGVNLPTIDDTGPTLFITGPVGGSGGIGVSNYSALVMDSTGTKQPTYFTLPFNLPTANDSVFLDFAKQSFFHNGVPFRPAKPVDANGQRYQSGYFVVKAGVVNTCTVGALGNSPLTGGVLTHRWWRKFA